MKKFKHGFIVLRAQPFHIGHKYIIDEMLINCNQITVILGSIQEIRSKKNPFTFEERKQMISNVYSHEKSIKIFGLKDFPYEDDVWYKEILNILKNNSFGLADVYYCGDKINGDFLDFGDFVIITIDRTKQVGKYNISATEIRNMIKNNNEEWKLFIPEINIEYINKLKNTIIDIL